MVFAAVLSLPASMVLLADETQPTWLPEVMELPMDMDLLTDRAIGSKLRMFSFSTDDDPESLLIEWEEALQMSGYTIDQAQDTVLDKVIEFSGQNINNAKVVISPISDDGRAVIQIDATLK